MSKIIKAMAALGVVAGLGVAALPLSSYAADNYSQSTSAKVQVEVGGAISITTNAENGLVDLGQMKLNGLSTTKDLEVTVTSNAQVGYDLTIRSLNYDGTLPETGEDDTTAGVLTNKNGVQIVSSANVAAGTSAWGYRLYDGETAGDWKKITGSPVNIKNHDATTDTGAMTDVTKVNFGASANGTQDEGIYAGTVIFTATVAGATAPENE